MTNNDYFEQAKKLLPQGLIWGAAKGGKLAALLETAAGHLSACHHRAENLIIEAIPQTARELLTEWEDFAGLPDECTAGEDLSPAERQDAVVEKLTAKGNLSVQKYIDLAARLGYEITIREYVPFTAGRSRCGGPHVLGTIHEPFIAGLSRCGGPPYITRVRYFWKVNVAGRYAQWFRCGRNTGGERLGSLKPARDLECFFRRRKPANTVIIFNYQEDL